MNRLICVFSWLLLFSSHAQSQPPASLTSSQILHHMKKLEVLGSVLYIAAHPDDENTRLLSWLSNEKLYRTGYLSITRGDGGQNLIGDEQGIELGLIRTRELLAARRIDGAEQFFTSAYDFGYSKSPEETFEFWDHDKVLADVVWVIRTFRPDILIARFPTTGEGGHGHHTASAVLAEEAFDAAGDSSRFTEQFKYGIRPWKPRRLLWNTFNFGSANTQREDQFKQDVGQFNALLGKSYGEMAAESRSQHKSQGFGVPSQRGSILEYFKPIRGSAPSSSLMEEVDVTWNRAGLPQASTLIRQMIRNYDVADPSRSANDLLALYDLVSKGCKDEYWKEVMLGRIGNLIAAASGLYMLASSAVPYAVQGDSIYINAQIINRSSFSVDSAAVSCFGKNLSFGVLKSNVNAQVTIGAFINADEKLSQPYWLREPMEKGRFHWTDPMMTGKAEEEPLQAVFRIFAGGKVLAFPVPLQYKTTDPVKGELFAPLIVTSPLSVKPVQSVFLTGNDQKKTALATVTARRNLSFEPYKLSAGEVNPATGDTASLRKDARRNYSFPVSGNGSLKLKMRSGGMIMDRELRTIRYDHIPVINYHRAATMKVVSGDIQTGSRKKIGYIMGAGDKVPEALDQMGYAVTFLGEQDMRREMLLSFDAVICGVRAYNTNEWLYANNEQLMQYVKAGGNLIVQYNTNSWSGPAKGEFGPYPFVISRNRVTDEESPVEFTDPGHPALSKPNRITAEDFRGWVQERSIYHADKTDARYQTILRMNDKNEKPDEGSLIIAPYGKGNFVYTGLSFFRQLPAGVTGAYRLFVNLIALPQHEDKSK